MCIEEVSQSLAAQDRSWLTDARHYDESSVGRLMTQDVVTVRDTQTVADVLDELRTLREIPDQTDRLFAVDARQIVRGAIPLHLLVRSDPATIIEGHDGGGSRQLHPWHARGAGRQGVREIRPRLGTGRRRSRQAHRPDHRSTASWTTCGRPSEQLALTRAGLRAPRICSRMCATSVHNRWPWLALNLVTAFLASRVISQFEDTISSVVALAALMPIVASIGGNTGNQTVALVIRALALDQLREQHGQLIRKELTVSLVNGLMWGAVTGLLAFALYGNAALGAVMMTAVLLNLIVAAVTGIAVPLVLHRARRDPAQGASVMLTFVTDSMGFFLFLGLARLLLR